MEKYLCIAGMNPGLQMHVTILQQHRCISFLRTSTVKVGIICEETVEEILICVGISEEIGITAAGCVT